MLSSCPHEDFRGRPGPCPGLAPIPAVALGARDCAKYRAFRPPSTCRASANREQAERNRQLVAEVADLKVGSGRARRTRPQRTRHGGQQRNLLPSRDGGDAGSRRACRPPSPPARSELAERAARLGHRSRRRPRRALFRSPPRIVPKQYAPLLGRHACWNGRCARCWPSRECTPWCVALAADDGRLAERRGKTRIAQASDHHRRRQSAGFGGEWAEVPGGASRRG